jgi:hypothetical protein
MARYRFVAGLAFGLLLALGITGAARLAGSEEDPFSEEMMKRWKEISTPGERHKDLGRFVGTWDVELKMLMPGAPPQVTKGTAEYSWLMEGRWLQERLKGEMMGQPFDGFGVFGWDNFKKEYVSSWVDSMSTAMAHSEGVPVDPDGKVVVQWGTMDEPLTGEHDKAVKLVTRMSGPDKFTFEIWDMGIGESGAVVMQFTYTRKK